MRYRWETVLIWVRATGGDGEKQAGVGVGVSRDSGNWMWDVKETSRNDAGIFGSSNQKHEVTGY